MKNLLAAAVCLLTSVGIIRAQSVDAVLARMDQAAPGFHAMSANVEMLTYTKILDDKTLEKGTLKMQRQKDKEVRAILDFSREADARVIAFLGNIVKIYYPKLKEYQDYDMGKISDVLNQFLLLGFGSSGKELERSYSISLSGSEKVGGVETTKLLLVPKDAKVLERLSKIEVWIPNEAAYPVQQQFYEPSGNYRRVAYSDQKVNPPMPKVLELKLPPGAKKQSK